LRNKICRKINQLVPFGTYFQRPENKADYEFFGKLKLVWIEKRYINMKNRLARWPINSITSRRRGLRLWRRRDEAN